MADEQDKWLDRETAEFLLRGEPLEGADPAVRDRAERLLAALGALAPPVPAGEELPGEAAALAAFRKVRAEQADASAGVSAAVGHGAADRLSGAGPVRVGSRGEGARRPRRGRPLRLGLAAALTVGMIGGVAAAAGTGVLPTPFDRTEPEPAATVSAAASPAVRSPRPRRWTACRAGRCRVPPRVRPRGHRAGRRRSPGPRCRRPEPRRLRRPAVEPRRVLPEGARRQGTRHRPPARAEGGGRGSLAGREVLRRPPRRNRHRRPGRHRPGHPGGPVREGELRGDTGDGDGQGEKSDAGGKGGKGGKDGKDGKSDEGEGKGNGKGNGQGKDKGKGQGKGDDDGNGGDEDDAGIAPPRRGPHHPARPHHPDRAHGPHTSPAHRPQPQHTGAPHAA